MELLDNYPENSKILLIGSFPPPLGGVSVHVKRLSQQLSKKGCEVRIIDFEKQPGMKSIIFLKLIKLAFIANYDIIHIHTSNLLIDLMLLILRYFRGYKIYYTHHNPRVLSNISGIKKYFIKGLIRHLDLLVLVSGQILSIYEQDQIILPKNVLVKNAFLPPSLSEECSIIETYSDETKDFVETHKPLLIANAFKIIFYNNMDLYGLDLCVELVHKLKIDFPKIGFLFALADETVNTDYLIEMKNKIIERDIKHNFHFMSGQKELWPLFRKADISIRPTITDGDALSIRESLYFNCPAIASDAVKRPKGTITFKNRDISDLLLCVTNLLNKAY